MAQGHERRRLRRQACAVTVKVAKKKPQRSPAAHCSWGARPACRSGRRPAAFPRPLPLPLWAITMRRARMRAYTASETLAATPSASPLCRFCSGGLWPLPALSLSRRSAARSRKSAATGVLWTGVPAPAVHSLRSFRGNWSSRPQQNGKFLLRTARGARVPPGVRCGPVLEGHAPSWPRPKRRDRSASQCNKRRTQAVGCAVGGEEQELILWR